MGTHPCSQKQRSNRKVFNPFLNKHLFSSRGGTEPGCIFQRNVSIPPLTFFFSQQQQNANNNICNE